MRVHTSPSCYMGALTLQVLIAEGAGIQYLVGFPNACNAHFRALDETMLSRDAVEEMAVQTRDCFQESAMPCSPELFLFEGIKGTKLDFDEAGKLIGPAAFLERF
jgi:hypothetical protein